MMRGKRGNLEKDVKIKCSNFDLEEAAALSWMLKNQGIIFLISILGLSSSNTEAGLLCTSRKLLLLKKVHHGGQQNFKKTSSMRENKEKFETAS